MKIENQSDYNMAQWIYKYLWNDYQKLLRKKRIPVGFQQTLREYNYAFEKFQKSFRVYASDQGHNEPTFGKLVNPADYIEEPA